MKIFWNIVEFGYKAQAFVTFRTKATEKILVKNKDLFPDTPSCTSVTFQDEVVRDAKPIQQHPYHVNGGKLEEMIKERK